MLLKWPGAKCHFFEHFGFWGSKMARNGHKMAQEGVVGGGGAQRVNFEFLRLPDPLGDINNDSQQKKSIFPPREAEKWLSPIGKMWLILGN